MAQGVALHCKTHSCWFAECEFFKARILPSTGHFSLSAHRIRIQGLTISYLLINYSAWSC